jgi:hypothetical protein
MNPDYSDDRRKIFIDYLPTEKETKKKRKTKKVEIKVEITIKITLMFASWKVLVVVRTAAKKNKCFGYFESVKKVLIRDI